MSNIFPLGFETKYIGPEGADILEEWLSYVSTTELAEAADASMYGSVLHKKITRVSKAMYALDSIAGFDDSRWERAKVFFKGSMIAGSVFIDDLSTEQKEALGAIQLPVKTDEYIIDPIETKIEDAKLFLALGRSAFQDINDLHDLFEHRILGSISPDERTANVARAGFGFPFYLLSTAIEAELSRNIAGWDDELQELLKDNENQ